MSLDVQGVVDRDVASADGPLSGTADTTYYRYDDARQLVGVIGPDPDGAGPLLRRAQRATYNADGAVTLSEQGTVTGLTDANWSAFATLQQAATAFDAYGRPTHQRLQSGGTTHSLVQASYDAAGQVTSTISGYGSGAPITESATYTANGKPLTLTDGKGNVSTLVYDGFDRTSRLRYPNPSGGGSSTTDYEEYTYDAGSNVLTYRNRGGDVFALTYDALNRTTLLDAPTGTNDTSFTYDLLGRRTGPTLGNGGVSNWTYDGANRKEHIGLNAPVVRVLTAIQPLTRAAARRPG